MIDKGSDEWKIASNELGHTVSLAIDKFKKAIGCARCSIETTDYEDEDDDFGDDYDDE